MQIYSLTGVDPNDLVLFVEGIAGPVTTRINLASMTTPSGSSSSSSSSSSIIVAVMDRSKHLLSRLGAGVAARHRIDDWPLSLVESALKQQIQEAQINGQSESVNMSQRLISGAKHVRCYEDLKMIEKTLTVIPVAELLRKATETYALQQESSEETLSVVESMKKTFQYHLLSQLTQWFKYRFFKWANNLPCSSCGSGETDGVGGSAPTAEERMIGWAGMAELYKCRACKAVSRFPRLNNPAALLDSKIGRCGEWANCFTLCCLAMGFEARHVHDWTDHVWTEVFIEEDEKTSSIGSSSSSSSSFSSFSSDDDSQTALHKAAGIVKGRWIHVDSCEASIDAPLLYEGGWGKKLSYVIAFGLDEVVDVSKRYTRNYTDMLTRRSFAREEWLQQFIACQDIIQRLGTQRSAGVSASRQSVLLSRKTREMNELMKSGGGDASIEADNVGQGERSGSSASANTPQLRSEEAIGRTTGSVEWRAARGELGTGEAAVKALQGGKDLINSGNVVVGKGKESNEGVALVEDKRQETSDKQLPIEAATTTKATAGSIASTSATAATAAATTTTTTTSTRISTMTSKTCLAELFSMMTVGCGKNETCSNVLCVSSALFDKSLEGLSSTQIAAKGMMMMIQDKKKVEEAICQGCGGGGGV